MSTLKLAKIGVYDSKDRALQKRLSFEKTSLTHKTVNVYKYLGSRTNITPTINDIPDPIFMEVRDRAYETTPIEINCWFEFLPEGPLDLSRFGIINPLGDYQEFRFHINSFEADGLGRYLIEGDILEVPFLLEDGRKAMFEVKDLDRKGEFENFFVIANAEPILDSQEVAEIPNIPTNSDVLQAIEDNMENLAEAAVTVGGVTTSDDVYIADDWIASGYYEDTREDYDPRPDDGAGFLDDPNSEIL